jgi:hypothetical protein
MGPRSSFSDNPRRGNPNEDTTGLVDSLSTFKFGSMNSVSDQIVGTPATELGPFEYPILNPDEDDIEDPTGRRLSESSLKGGLRAGPLGLPLRRPVEEAVAVGPGIGSLRRMSTMNQVMLASVGTGTETEVRRPSVVHSNTVPLVTTTTGSTNGEQEADGRKENELERAETPDLKTSSLLQSRRATLDNGYEQAATGPSLALPPGSISAAAAGAVNLSRATSTKRRSILSFGREGPVDTPVPPSLAGLVSGGVVETGASPAPSTSKAMASSMAALRRGSMPAVRYDPTSMNRERNPSISSPISQPKFNLVDPARSTFARASFSSDAGPIVVDQGTKWERTTVSSAYLYARRNSLAHPIGPSLGLTGRASAAVAMRPGLAPFQPPDSDHRRPSNVSEDGRSASGSTSVTGSSTGSVQTLREARSGSAVSTVMGADDRVPSGINGDDSDVYTPPITQAVHRTGQIGFREDIFQQNPRPSHRDQGMDPLSYDSDDYHQAYLFGKRSSMSESDRRGSGPSMGSPRARLNSLGAAQPLSSPRGSGIASRFMPSAYSTLANNGASFGSGSGTGAVPRRSSASAQSRPSTTSAGGPVAGFSFGTSYNADSAFYTSSSEDSGRDGASSSSSSISSASSSGRGRRKWNKRSSLDNGHRFVDDARSGPILSQQGEGQTPGPDIASSGSRHRGSGIGYEYTHPDLPSKSSSFSFSSAGGGSGSSSSSLEAFAEEPDEAEVEVGTPWTEVMVSLQHPGTNDDRQVDSGSVKSDGQEPAPDDHPQVVSASTEEEASSTGEDDDVKDKKKRDKEFRDFAFGKNALQRRQGSLSRASGPAI